MARGPWGWHVAREICKEEGTYNEKQELSFLNKYHILTRIMVGTAAIGVCIGTYFQGKKIWNLYGNDIKTFVKSAKDTVLQKIQKN